MILSINPTGRLTGQNDTILFNSSVLIHNIYIQQDNSNILDFVIFFENRSTASTSNGYSMNRGLFKSYNTSGTGVFYPGVLIRKGTGATQKIFKYFVQNPFVCNAIRLYYFTTTVIPCSVIFEFTLGQKENKISKVLPPLYR